MTLGELAKYIPVTLLSWAFVLVAVVFSAFSGLAIYAWFTKQTLVLGGYDFGRPSIGSGAVVAYDLSKCPSGWKPFKPATARFIVGAGEEFEASLRTDKDGNPLSVRRYNEHDGFEEITLTTDQIPEHDHQGKSDYHVVRVGTDIGTGDNGWFPIHHTGPDPAQASNEPLTAKFGGGEPHNNMPPYIALYYCKKE